MTEQDWSNATDPQAMLEFLRGRASDRKLRLVAVGFCRQFWHSLPDEPGRSAVEVAECYADGAAGEETRTRWHWAAYGFCEDEPDGEALAHAVVCAVHDSATFAARHVSSGWAGTNDGDAQHAARTHCNLIRDIFGNPFRPVLLDPDWLSPAVVSLARAAYEERQLPAGTLDPARLAVLADALEEAGCTNPEVLSHCRSGGEHVRGCWVLDLLTGRE